MQESPRKPWIVVDFPWILDFPWISHGFSISFSSFASRPVLRNHVSLGSLLGRATQGIAQLEESLELQRRDGFKFDHDLTATEPWNHGLVKGNHPQDSRTFQMSELFFYSLRYVYPV